MHASPKIVTFVELPDELSAHLPDAGVAGIRDISETAVYIAARIHKLRVIEDVEELTPNLERHGFPHGNDLRYSEIRVVEARTMEKPPVRGAEGSAVGAWSDPREKAVRWGE